MEKKFKKITFWGGERATTPIWLTIYSDMMTNLMLFFLMLWALTRATLETQRIAQMSFVTTFGRGRLDIKIVKKEQQIPPDFEKIIKTETTAQGIRIVFDTPVLFDLGSAVLKEQTKQPLEKLATWLSDVPYKVIIEGHTDNIPIKRELRYSSNWELSLDRARSVVKFFQKKGINPKRLSVAGYGEYQPLYPNNTAQHRALNRRIELYILYKDEL
ncbi:MAG: flagellar motor protein MotB [Elusimicrobiota bacterium]